LKLATLVLVGCVGLTACGYHTAGHAVRLPQSVRTIAVPAFINKTQSYRLEQVLTAAVVREFDSRTRYHIINDADSSADAVLRGTVVSTSLAPLTYDAKTGRASTVLVTVNVKIEMMDRKGGVLYENPNYTLREEYQVSREISSFFEEESPALERLSRDFARTLVSNILEAY
jgi:outer membrane lipopolysaccharide assembly protein LptE/RlpB